MTRLRVAALALGCAALLGGCLAARPVGEAGGQAPGAETLGSFSVASASFGAQVLAPAVCTAGDRQFFLGADLAAPGSPLVLRLVVDPLDGPAVRVFLAEAPFDRSVVFYRQDCRVFHFSLDGTGWRVNDVADYRLTLELDCARAGEAVSGRASSAHCH